MFTLLLINSFTYLLTYLPRRDRDVSENVSRETRDRQYGVQNRVIHPWFWVLTPRISLACTQCDHSFAAPVYQLSQWFYANDIHSCTRSFCDRLSSFIGVEILVFTVQWRAIVAYFVNILSFDPSFVRIVYRIVLSYETGTLAFDGWFNYSCPPCAAKPVLF